MKRFLIIYFFLSFSVISASAQDIANDFFRNLSKKIEKNDAAKKGNDSIPYINPNGSNTKQNNYFIVDSCILANIHRYLFVVRQDYSLYNSKKKLYYGYNDLDYFGNTYSLGVKCEKFTILSDEAVYPWKYDSKYSDFKDKNLIPQITRTHVLVLDDSVSYDYSELDSVLVVKKTIKDEMFYVADPMTNSQDGLKINTSDSCKSGVLVWIVKKSGDMDKGDIKIDLKCMVKTFDLLGNIAVTPPADCKEVLGCLYLTESGDKEIPYLLSGIAALNNQQWTLYFPFKNFQLESVKGMTKSKDKGRLTEIKPNKVRL